MDPKLAGWGAVLRERGVCRGHGGAGALGERARVSDADILLASPLFVMPGLRRQGEEA
jgi:hypothetical protein